MHEVGLCSSIIEAIERPTCGAVEVELLGGDELMLESIEYQG